MMVSYITILENNNLYYFSIIILYNRVLLFKMVYLPDEITMIILSVLPVKALLRFKYVLRSWHCWISNPNFHLSNQRREEGAIVNATWNSNPSFQLIKQQLIVEELNYPLSHDDEIFFSKFNDFRLLSWSYTD